MTRRWHIEIAEVGGALEVTGHQLSASVDAPPTLAALAAIEQGRDASGVFPIELDAAGLIRSTGGSDHASPSPPVPLVRGVETARLLFATLPKARAGRLSRRDASSPSLPR